MADPVAPETQARAALITMLGTVFAADAFPIKDDKLNRSLGHHGTVLGVYVDRTISAPNNRYVSEMELVVQFYGKYDLKVDPHQTVSPAAIETRAERFRQGLQAGVDPNTGSVWYFTLDRVEFPDDPTGNKTRFEAHLTARGNNTALLETTG